MSDNLSPLSGVTSPAGWFTDALGGSATTSTVRVDWWTALQSGPVAACVHILSEDIAKLPVRLYKRKSNGGRDELTSHPVWRILAIKPNRWMTPFDYKAAMVTQYCLHGNAVALINRDVAGRPSELVPIDVPRVALWVADSEIWYYISFSNDLHRREYNAYGALFPASDVLHVKRHPAWGPGLWGYSPILMAREVIGNALTLDKYAGNLYANYADIGGVLQHPGQLSEQALVRLRRQWETRYSGGDNRGRTAILEEGLKFEKMAMTAADAEFVHSRKFSVEEVARIFRMPPYKLMDYTRMIQSNIEETSYSYADDTLVPILENFEKAYTDKLLTGREQITVEIEHDLTRFLRGRAADRYEVYTKAIAHGMMTPNEARVAEGMNPEEGGDVFYRNVNLVPRDMDPLAMATPEKQMSEDAAAVLKRAARRGERPNGHMNGDGH